LNIAKPILDIILFSRKLSELVGWEGPALTLSSFALFGFVIKAISPPFGKLIAIE
jgi:ATP-binding cassette subfamily D (ALD) protein 3